jgi:hypothetical protein
MTAIERRSSGGGDRRTIGLRAARSDSEQPETVRRAEDRLSVIPVPPSLLLGFGGGRDRRSKLHPVGSRAFPVLPT